MSRAWLLAALALAACGGSDSAFEEALAAADAKEAEAVALGVDTPCDRVDQCGSLQFGNPTKGCGTNHYHPYSLVSATAAAASAASGEQRDLAAVARALDKPYPFACPFVAESPPPLACVAGRCQVAVP
jgi:hypothetical protein